MEALCCGRPVITTREVAEKRVYNTLLQDPQNSFVIDGTVNGRGVADTIRRAYNHITQAGEMSLPRISQDTDLLHRVRMRRLLESVESRI